MALNTNNQSIKNQHQTPIPLLFYLTKLKESGDMSSKSVISKLQLWHKHFNYNRNIYMFYFPVFQGLFSHVDDFEASDRTTFRINIRYVYNDERLETDMLI